MNKIGVYLAGAFCPIKQDCKEYLDWRDYVFKNLKNSIVSLHDPRTQSRQLCPASFCLDDMSGVLKNPVLFHYSRGGYEDEGASWEHGGAFAYNMLINKGVLKGKEKLIINVDERRAPFPLHFASANVTFTNLEIAVGFLNELKSTEKGDWFKIYNNILNKVRGTIKE